MADPKICIYPHYIIKNVIYQRNAAEDQNAEGIFLKNLRYIIRKATQYNKTDPCSNDDLYNKDSYAVNTKCFNQQSKPFGGLTAQIGEEHRGQSGDEPLAAPICEQNTAQSLLLIASKITSIVFWSTKLIWSCSLPIKYSLFVI